MGDSEEKGMEQRSGQFAEVTKESVKILSGFFEVNELPSKAQVRNFADRTGLNVEQVGLYFSSRRQRDVSGYEIRKKDEITAASVLDLRSSSSSTRLHLQEIHSIMLLISSDEDKCLLLSGIRTLAGKVNWNDGGKDENNHNNDSYSYLEVLGDWMKEARKQNKTEVLKEILKFMEVITMKTEPYIMKNVAAYTSGLDKYVKLLKKSYPDNGKLLFLHYGIEILIVYLQKSALLQVEY